MMRLGLLIEIKEYNGKKSVSPKTLDDSRKCYIRHEENRVRPPIFGKSMNKNNVTSYGQRDCRAFVSEACRKVRRRGRCRRQR